MSVKKMTEICFKRQPQRTLVAKRKLLGRSPWGATGSWLCMKTAQGRAVFSADIISDPTPGWLTKAW